MRIYDGDTARAYNAGSDARIAGEPCSANPYHTDDALLYKSWRKGWQDADAEWGIEARGRAHQLPPIRTRAMRG